MDNVRCICSRTILSIDFMKHIGSCKFVNQIIIELDLEFTNFLEKFYSKLGSGPESLKTLRIMMNLYTGIIENKLLKRYIVTLIFY